MFKRFRSYGRYLRPYRMVFWGAMGAAAIYGASTGFGISYMLKQVLPTLFEPDAERLPLASLIGIALLIPLAFVVRGISGWLHVVWINRVGMGALEDLRNDVFDKIQRLQLVFFRKRPTGDLMSRLANDTQLVQQMLTTVASDIVKQPLTLLFALSYLVYESINNSEILFVLASIAAVPLCILPIRYLGRNLLKRARQQQEQTGDLTGILSENLQGALEIRAFGQEQAQKDLFRGRLRLLVSTQMKVVRYFHALNPSIEVIASCGIAAAFATAYLKGIRLEAFIALMPALYFSYEPIKRIGGIHMNIQRGTGALERIDDILIEPILTKDPEPGTQADPHLLAGAIEFQNLSFRYGSEPVLNQLNLTIEPGTFTAIVGPSGAGKSTLISLLPRFYDPTEGSICISGKDLRSFSLQDLRSQIAIVPQDPFLFRDTLLNNIRTGRPDADEAAVHQAAQDAHIHDFIQSLPDGYHTMAGERGNQLSGGQRQRIAVARAFLRNTPILILDEATSALDSESEQKVQDALGRLIAGRTVFVVAHRFSTIRKADRVLLLDKGKLAADGKMESLMNHPTFLKLYEHQQLG